MIQDLIYNLRLEIENESIKYVNGLKADKSLFEYREYYYTIHYLEILEKEYNNRIRGFKECLSKKELECLLDRILKIVGKQCTINKRDLLIDSSKKDLWIKNNIFCTPYSEWIKYSKKICDRINIDFKVERKICDFTLELVRKVIPCNILIYLQAVKKSCDLGIKLDVDKVRCEAELKILREKVNCDLDINLYRDLKSCNINFDFIKEVYSCGLSLKIDSYKCPILVSNLNEYPLNDLNPQNLESLKEFNNIPTIDVQNILNNYQ